MKRKISILRDYCNTIGRDANELQFSVVLPCIIGESENEVYQSLVRHKRNDKTLEQYLQYLVGGITIGIPEKIIKGLNEYIDVGISHFIMHFIELNMQTLKLFESEVISKI
jgi:alkanesulfonate monooxygenase SsuD/methylene tetrahydromethanopterin reductase-like flavin-dependent oxidoreductase (luciferase family)